MTHKLYPLLLALTASVTLAADNGWDDAGLDWGDSWETETTEPSPWNLSGFTDFGYGEFVHDNPVDDTQSLLELRSQFSANRYFGNHFFSSKLELILDDVDDHPVQFEARELFVDLHLSNSVSLRAGQQILTWGTGDFVFLNDFFPKDWQAMFSGRDDDYLKAPSTSIKTTFYHAAVNTDLVWTPDFTGDVFISGERFAYFSPTAGDVVAAPPKIKAKEPSPQFSHGQFALRLFKTVNGVEYALYGYRGYYTQPLGYDPVKQVNTYPRLNSAGASIRSPLLGGIANAEMAYWDSLDDDKGDNPLIPNSQWNLLFGFEREAVTNFTIGLQMLLQQMQDYDAAKAASITPAYLVDELHSTVTTRLTYLAMQQKLTWSLFMFYSADAKDIYLKPKLSYRHDDHWLFVVGANDFNGADNFTQWGQFEKNSNIYARMRYSF